MFVVIVIAQGDCTLRPPIKPALQKRLRKLGKDAVGTADGRYTLLLTATAEKKGCGQKDDNGQKVALESVPKLMLPVPLVSKVLPDRAPVLDSTSDPPLTSVTPVKTLDVARVNLPVPILVSEPMPLKSPL